MNNMIYPCLWFDGIAKEAAQFYCSVFDNSSITSENQIVIVFESNGQKFMFLNGGPEYKINPSVSFWVVCKTENEIDKTWKSLIDGGSALMPLDKYDWSEKYGWVQDRYGVSWQLSFGNIADMAQKFTPFIMFTGKQSGRAEQAINFYKTVFEGSGIKGIMRYSKGENEVEGTVKHAEFSLGKHRFMAMDSSNSLREAYE
jgi:predicted 3-demethylubiquinone-9 3-methyltransferase (glyoxalase superfamily)